MEGAYIPLIGCPDFDDMRRFRPRRDLYRAGDVEFFPLRLTR
jgi:hypothetical protein